MGAEVGASISAGWQRGSPQCRGKGGEALGRLPQEGLANRTLVALPLPHSRFLFSVLRTVPCVYNNPPPSHYHHRLNSVAEDNLRNCFGAASGCSDPRPLHDSPQPQSPEPAWGVAQPQVPQSPLSTEAIKQPGVQEALGEHQISSADVGEQAACLRVLLLPLDGAQPTSVSRQVDGPFGFEAPYVLYSSAFIHR